jgi:hypothetical protein
LEADPHNDGHDHEAFLVTTRPVRAGEELMWSYNVSQSHRSIAQVPTNDEEAEVAPAPAPAPAKKQTPPPKLPASAAPKITTKQTPPQKLPAAGGNASAARGSAAAPKNRETCAASAAAADLPAAGGNAFDANDAFSYASSKDDEEAEVAPRKITTKQTPPPKLPASAAPKITTKQTPPPKLPASAAPKITTKQTPPQKLPAAGGNASAVRSSSSPEKRCQGCLCVNPCSNPRHCLTPQKNLSKRVSVSKQFSE